MLGLEFCGPIGLLILTANLLKYVHVLKIEGEIALLSLYCNNCYTAKKKCCTHCALSVSCRKNN